MHSDENNGQPACKAFDALKTPRAKPRYQDVIAHIQARKKKIFFFSLFPYYLVPAASIFDLHIAQQPISKPPLRPVPGSLSQGSLHHHQTLYLVS